jgi:hypothetical protein
MVERKNKKKGKKVAVIDMQGWMAWHKLSPPAKTPPLRFDLQPLLLPFSHYPRRNSRNTGIENESSLTHDTLNRHRWNRDINEWVKMTPEEIKKSKEAAEQRKKEEEAAKQEKHD